MIPSDHARHICAYHEADEATVARAIYGALAAKAGWEAMPWGDRAAIFLKAADLVSKKYRYRLMAATILGQGKNVWQALSFSACGLFPLWREVCRGALLSATAEELRWFVEVRALSLCLVYMRGF